MCTYQNTASAIVQSYDIFYGGHKSDAGDGLGRRFLDWYGLRFSTTLWNVFVIELSDFVCAFGCTDGYGIWKNWVSLAKDRLD
jgi:hypothetical protein